MTLKPFHWATNDYRLWRNLGGPLSVEMSVSNATNPQLVDRSKRAKSVLPMKNPESGFTSLQFRSALSQAEKSALLNHNRLTNTVTISSQRTLYGVDWNSVCVKIEKVVICFKSRRLIYVRIHKPLWGKENIWNIQRKFIWNFVKQMRYNCICTRMERKKCQLN